MSWAAGDVFCQRAKEFGWVCPFQEVVEVAVWSEIFVVADFEGGETWTVVYELGEVEFSDAGEGVGGGLVDVDGNMLDLLAIVVDCGLWIAFEDFAESVSK